MSVWPTSVVGIPTPTESTESGVHAVATWARTNRLTPQAAVAAWAEQQAAAMGTSLRDRGLRLFDDDAAVAAVGEPCPVSSGRPSDLGHLYETLLSGEVRKRGGVHLTPADVAARLVGLLGDGWQRPGVRVLDPSVGGGAFLLAAADALVATGVDPDLASAGLLGVDHDPVAVSIAEAAIALWRCGHGLDIGPSVGLVAGDGLLDPLPTCDVVVGNPPFLNQLRSHSANAGDRRAALRERWGDVVTAYTDEAWLFLTAAVDAVVPGGQVVMVQPVSVLAARHGEAVRERLDADATLDGLWISDGNVFEASVEVCAPLLRRRDADGRGESARPQLKVRRWRGRAFSELESRSAAPAAPEWGRIGAAITGIPEVRLRGGASTMADLATVTAGFRDQFYGLAPYVSDLPGGSDPDGVDPDDARRLVTVGMLDPFRLRWGSAAFRFAGERYVAPVLDAAALERADPELGRWVEARRRPKVLLATQTKVIEAWVDRSGMAVPATPTISLEPHDADDPQALWRIVAVLMTPAVSADVAAACFGTALSIRALKVSARDMAALPLPADAGAWDDGAELAQMIQESAGRGDDADAVQLRSFGDAMHRAFGNDALGVLGEQASDALMQWWLDGWPKRR